MSVSQPKSGSFKSPQKRYSAGLALCRYNHKKKKIEIVFVKKRYTYWFSLFVLGAYNKNDEPRLLFMFSKMTPEEKLLIHSLDFESMWNYLWLTKSHNPQFKKKRPISNFDFYKKKKNKFEQFLFDKGRTLRRIIGNSNNKALVWEMPKGRLNPEESAIECAVREFGEETRIDKRKYEILPNIKPISTSHRDGNFYYKSTYYFARAKCDINLNLDFNYLKQVCEIIDIKWLTLDEINLLNSTQQKFHTQVFNAVKHLRQT